MLDRDGTIIVDSGYVGAVEDVVFLDGAIAAIARLNAAGIPVAVVTNQSGVARGMYDLADVELVHKYMAAELARSGAHVDEWLFCPYHPDGMVRAFARFSSDRKPGPGMALAAADLLDLDLASSWVVGDSACDIGMAQAVGARPFLISAGPETPPGPGVDVVPSLAAAVDAILAEHALAGPASSPGAVFPARRYDDGGSFATEYARELDRAMTSVAPAQFHAAAEVLRGAYERDSTVFSCGNGGSASIANHFQCDHVKGVRVGTGLLTRVHSLSTNMEILSAIANDIGYERVFDFQLESQARPEMCWWPSRPRVARQTSSVHWSGVPRTGSRRCAHRLHRWAGTGAGDRVDPRRLAQLRHRRGCPPGLHARARAVRTAVAHAER